MFSAALLLLLGQVFLCNTTGENMKKSLISWSGRYWQMSLLITWADMGIQCKCQPRWGDNIFFLAKWGPDICVFSLENILKKWRITLFLYFGSSWQILADPGRRPSIRERGWMLSPAGVRIYVFDDIKANGHGRHGYCPSSSQRLGLQFWERLIVHH